MPLEVFTYPMAAIICGEVRRQPQEQAGFTAAFPETEGHVVTSFRGGRRRVNEQRETKGFPSVTSFPAAGCHPPYEAIALAGEIPESWGAVRLPEGPRTT